MIKKIVEVFEAMAEKEGLIEKREIAQVEGDLLTAHRVHANFIKDQKAEMKAFMDQKKQEIRDKAESLQLLEKVNHDKVWGETYKELGLDPEESYEIDIETGVLTQVIFKGGEEEKE